MIKIIKTIVTHNSENHTGIANEYNCFWNTGLSFKFRGEEATETKLIFHPTIFDGKHTNEGDDDTVGESRPVSHIVLDGGEGGSPAEGEENGAQAEEDRGEGGDGVAGRREGGCLCYHTPNHHHTLQQTHHQPHHRDKPVKEDHVNIFGLGFWYGLSWIVLKQLANMYNVAGSLAFLYSMNTMNTTRLQITRAVLVCACVRVFVFLRVYVQNLKRKI